MAQSIVAGFSLSISLASSHAYSTVTEVARQAAAMGMLAVGCTDHGIGIEDAPHLWHFLNLRILPPYIDGVRVLRGVEANVMDFTGRLDMPEEAFQRLELVIASMHEGLCRRGAGRSIPRLAGSGRQSPGGYHRPQRRPLLRL